LFGSAFSCADRFHGLSNHERPFSTNGAMVGDEKFEPMGSGLRGLPPSLTITPLDVACARV
jgi:hypothetical protein